MKLPREVLWPRAAVLASCTAALNCWVALYGGMAIGACLITLNGCGGGTPTTTPAGSPELAGIATVRDGERPALTLLRRDGDGMTALAVAIAHDAGPGYNRSLQTALDRRWKSYGLTPQTQLLTRGLISSFTADTLPARELMQRVQSGLREAQQTARLEPGNAATDPCDPLPIFADTAPELGFQNVSVAVVGTSQRVDELATAFMETVDWPSGDIAAAELPERDVFLWQRAAEPGLTLAVRVERTAALLNARAALYEPNSLLRKLATEFAPGFELEAVNASFLPLGGCLSLSFSGRSEVNAEQAAMLTAAAQTLVTSALDTAAATDRLVPALAATSALKAAELAAWQGLTSEGDGAQRWLVVRDASTARRSQPVEDSETQSQYLALSQRKTLPLETRLELGQGRLWAALQSQCPLSHEQRDSAGFTAVTLAAGAASVVPEGAAQVWTGYGGPALLANTTLLAGEEAERVADQLAESLFAALSAGPELAVVAQASRDAQPQSALLDFTAELLTGGHPSAVLGRGTHEALAGINPLAGRNAVLSFLRTPLTLTVLANRDQEQAERVQRRLELLLAPFTDPNARCPAPEPLRLAGSYVLNDGADPAGADAVLAYPVPSDQLTAARAVAYLLNRPDGFLAQALAPFRPNAEASAAALASLGGHAALFIAIRADAATLTDVVQQVRGLMQRIAGGALTERHHKAAQTQSAELERSAPEVRLLERALRQPALPNLSELRRFAHAHLSEAQLVLVSAQQQPQ